MELIRFGESLLIVQRDAQQAFNPRIVRMSFQFGSKGYFGSLEIASRHCDRRRFRRHALICARCRGTAEQQSRNQ
jgi:hypothetical protein